MMRGMDRGGEKVDRCRGAGETAREEQGADRGKALGHVHKEDLPR